jgi:RHS repeat-associated protein
MKRSICITFILVAGCILTGLQAKAQQQTGTANVIPVIPEPKPGETVRPEGSEKWTPEQFREWEKMIREKSGDFPQPERPPILKPDFTQMTEEQIVTWEDSVKSVLFPELESYNTGRLQSVLQSNNAAGGESPRIELRGDYANSHIPNIFAIDRNMTVGEIPFTSGVLPNGALTYSIPVETYPGINGHQPNVSLVYNSYGGNGIAGIGWSLGGLSAISRTGKNPYHDGRAEGVLMDRSDPFVLDGVRMIKTGETTSEISYETERGLVKATAYLSGSTMRYFQVWYPNGSIATYGFTGNYASNLSYPLTSIKDRFNNIITYTYDYSDNNHYTLTKISYGNASVEFQYLSSRNDPAVFYQGGLKVMENRLLQNIICKYGTSTSRTYSLAYSTQKGYSALTSIGLTASGLSVNPLQFYYGTNNTAYVYSTSQVQLDRWYVASPGQLRVSKGKFDYGTEDDGLISAPYKDPYWNHYRHSTTFRHSQNRYENQYDGTERIYVYAGLNAPLMAGFMPDIVTEAGFIDVFCADVDGKYEEEIVKVNNTRIDNTNEKVVFNVYAANLYNGLALKYTRTFTFPTVVTDADDGRSIHPKFYRAGDFNGDGKMEILAVSSHNPIGNTNITSKCYLFDLESNTKLYEGYAFPYVVEFWGTEQPDNILAFENTDHLMTLDYDGDGKSDVCLINSQGTHIYTFDISGSNYYSMRKIATYTGITKTGLKNRSLLVGEFNGDGKPDLLVSPDCSTADYIWTIHYSKGNGQFESRPFSATYYSRKEPVYLQDVNGDGLTDLIKCMYSSFFTYLINANGIAAVESATSYPANSIFIPTDINSGNYFGRIVCLKEGIVTKFAYPRNDTCEKLLTGLINSLGVIEKNHFRRLNEQGGYFYTKGSGANYPYINFNGPLHVPVSREQFYNNQRYGDVDYRYVNAVVHGQGLGFCGFAQVISYDRIRSRTSTQTYDPFRFGVLTGEDTPFSTVTNTVSVSVASSRIAKITLTGQSVQDKLQGTTRTATYRYDAYGNPTQETVTFGDGITQTTSSAYYNNTGTPYLLGFLTDRTVTASRSGSSDSRRMLISSHSNGLPTVKSLYVNGNRTSESTYAYNGAGCMTQETVKLYSSPNQLTYKFEYDSWGRVTKEIDPLNIYTTREYNATTGLPAYSRNHKSQATSYTYDGLGRITSVSYPDGTNETTTRTWSSGTGLYSVTSTATGKPNTVVYCDAFGREVRTSVTRYNGVVGHTDRTYDGYGRLQRQSLPFTGSSASYWNTYSYDSYDRPSSVSTASGNTVSYGYSGKNVMVTENGITSTRYHDAQGNLISVSDPAGTITYNLRADGQPSSIIAPGNVTTTFSYDGYGRQISISDPSAGTRSFGYDAAGNLNRETDADGRVKNMAYDAYNRLRTRTLPEFSTTWEYNSDNLPASVTSTNATSEVYTYDAYGRLSTYTENGPDSRWLKKTYGYADGNVNSIRYVSQLETIGTESHNYANGHLTEITFGGTSVWKLNGENVLGQPVSVATGPVSRAYSYGNHGLPTGRTSASTSSGTFQNHAYGFDAAKGNLTYRRDNHTGLQESFTYDNLNRLKTFAGKNMEYDAKGNITQKSDVGSTFYYDTPGKPYALSGVEAGTNTAIPMRSQAVAYTSFERPASISENSWAAAFTYNVSGGRVKMQLRQGGSSVLTRWYLGENYEIDEGTAGAKEKLYIGGDAYTAPAVYLKQNGSWNLHYISRDWLGSITHIANSSGAVVQELSYDVWGRLRNPSNQGVYSPDAEPSLLLGRGYTGHEHLTQFGLINMNARLYDPAVGRFLSPDPYVQAPLFSQNFNRYSYCMNNPLVYKDADGEIAWFVPIIVGAVIGGITNTVANHKHIDNFWAGAGYFGIGAAAGAAGAYAGGAVAGAVAVGGFAGGAVSGAAGGVASGFVAGSGNAWMGGAGFGQGLQSGLIGGGIGVVSGALIGGTIGAIQHQRQVYAFQKGNAELGINGGDPVPATDQFLSDAQKAWFKDAPMDKVKVFTVEKVPKNVQNEMDKIGATAATKYLHKSGTLTGNSNVYFNKNLAFTSAKQLFFTMEHEFVHVSQYAYLGSIGATSETVKAPLVIEMLDFHAYSYEWSLGSTNSGGFIQADILSFKNSSLFNPLNYINFSWNFNHSFIFPF